MNEQTKNTLLAVGAGLVVVIGIGFIVANSMKPVSAQMAALAESQSRSERLLKQTIDSLGKKNESQVLDGLEKRVEALEQKLTMITSGLGQQRRPMPSDAPNQPPAEDLNKVYTLDVGSTPVLGKVNAPVMITMFADFECPFCARFYEPIKEVLKAYPDKVKFMVKNFPLGFHQNAVPSAKAALAAGLQGKYFEMIDVLMKNKADASEAKLKEYAQALRLNEKKLLEDLKNKDAEFDKQIKEDMELGSRSDVRGTPTFFLNGKKSNSRDVNAWKAEIDQILSGK